MRDPIPEGDAITESPVPAAIAHADEQVDEHTPPTPVTPPADAADGLDAIAATVATLATSVAVLTDAVADLGDDDESPVASVPWTHFGGNHEDHTPDSLPWTHRGGHHSDDSDE